MICPCCGNDNEKNVKNCIYCGYNLAAPFQTTEQSQTQYTAPVNPVNSGTSVQSPNKSFVTRPTPRTKNKKIRSATHGTGGNTSKSSTNVTLLVVIGILVIAIGSIWFIGTKKTKETVEDPVVSDNLESQTVGIESQNKIDNSIVTDVPEATTAVPVEEQNRLVSDLEESIGGKIISGVPKAAYYFGFDQTLSGAIPVKRTERFQDPFPDASLSPEYTTGIIGDSIYLNGTYGLALDSVQPLGDAYSVAFWLNADSFSDYSPIIQIGSDILDTNHRADWVVLEQKTLETGETMSPILWSHQETAGNGFDVNPTLTSVRHLDSNSWYYLTIVIDGYTIGVNSQSIIGRVYVNGIKVGEGDTAPMSFAISDSKAFIGINPWDVSFTGKYDEIKLWNTVLSDEQVQSLYAAYVNY